MRPSKLQNFMAQAEIIAMRSHDSETKVGSVLIKKSNNTLVSTGFNGFIPNAPDDTLPTKRPDKYEFIQHSEMNLIANCAKNGISTEGCYVVCTMSPCTACVRLLVSAGIRKVVAKTLYKDFQYVLAMQDLDVSFKKNDEGFYIISYGKVKRPQQSRSLKSLNIV
jgi:dCMP deaminase